MSGRLFEESGRPFEILRRLNRVPGRLLGVLERLFRGSSGKIVESKRLYVVP